jgi:hypothetical protein
MVMNDARFRREIKSKIAMENAGLNKKKIPFANKLRLNLRKKLVKLYFWSITSYGAEIWTLCKVDQKYLESFEMWCWRRVEKISWTDRVRNEEALHRVKVESNIIHTIKRRKSDWTAHILHSHCLLKHVTEVKMEVRI